MNIPIEYRGKFFYHFTHADNIDSIVRYGLLSTNLKNEYGINHHNIANPKIQERRSEMIVEAGPGGVVHDYAPFYFTSKNPMLLSLLYSKNVDQNLIIFIAISIDKIMNSNVVFTDASANTIDPPNFYENPKDLDKLHWNLIENNKVAHLKDDEKHHKMAEVLVYKRVPIEWVDSYIVWNQECKKIIEKSYADAGLQKPKIYYEPFHGNKYFYFTKFNFANRENESLVTGPRTLYKKYCKALEQIEINRANGSWGNAKFTDIEDSLKVLRNNFSILPELQGIENLKTDNVVHSETVSAHTFSVVNNLHISSYYNYLCEHDKKVVTLTAYLHDIGKGPDTKWENGIQKAYPDHPADAIPMLIRILSEEFETLTSEEIRDVCTLVVYHDLLGDIIANGRDKGELINLNLKSGTLFMLAVLTEADIRAISSIWCFNYLYEVRMLLNEIMR